MIRAALVLLPLLAAACAPSPQSAARRCQANAPLADGIAGSVGVGVSNGGPVRTGSLTVTNRVFNPQSEEQFIADCIERALDGRPEPTTFGASSGERR